MKNLYLFLLFVLVSINIYGQRRTEKQAIDVAARFWGINNSKDLSIIAEDRVRNAIHKIKATSLQSAPPIPYYIVNDSINRRFVLIPSDERMGNILGYSDRGIFEIEKMPSGLLYILSSYNQLNNISSYEEITPKHNEEKSNAIEPLIKTHWGQDFPYNKDCPEIDGKKCPTGCAATALAQILNYYRYSPHGIGKHSYSTYTLDIEQSMDFENLDIDWDKLKNDYNDSSSSEECQEVAKLMHACGVSLSTDYKKSATGVMSNSIAYPLKHFWGYNPNIAYWRVLTDYGPREENEMLREELYNGHPVLVDLDERHEAIIDGMDENGLYHYNFGWDGIGDGFYRIALISTPAYFFRIGNYTINITPELYGENSPNFIINSMNTSKAVSMGDSIYVDAMLDCVSTDVPKSIMFIDEPLVTTIGIGLFDANFNLIHSFAESNGEFYSNYSVQITAAFSTEDIINRGDNVLYLSPYEKNTDGTYKHITGKRSSAEMYLIQIEGKSIRLISKHFSDIQDVEDNIYAPEISTVPVSIHTTKSHTEIISPFACTLRIYNINGICVSEIHAEANRKYTLTLPKGVYVINGQKFCVN